MTQPYAPSMRGKLAIFLALLLGLPAPVVPQSDQTDEYITAEMQRQNIPGLSLAVLKGGEVIKAEGYGLANIELGIAATPETVYKIGSVSKQFIATGIMLLVQEGRLGLEEPVGSFLEATPATWDDITIRHLLTHTSGLIREAPGFDPWQVQTDAAVIQTAHPLPLLFTPGERWEYSNVGYFVLAEVIRLLSGQPWSEYLSEEVFKPSGMNATRTTTTQEPVPNLALGYNDNDRLLEADDWPALRPSGAFLSTALDLAMWDAVLYGNDVLSDATRRQMWSPVKLNDGTSFPYGFGWELGEVRDHRQIHHGGGMTGFLSEFARFVDDQLTIIVLMNLDDADVESIARGVAGLYLPAPVPSRSR